MQLLIRTVLISAVALGIAMPASAQEAISDNDTLKLEEFVFSANKFKERKSYIAQPIDIISIKEIEWRMPQTSATMLEQTGNVFVQRSQAGGGSPVLRGFEANKVLLVVDGVRMNNAIYRGGHLQNVITLDNNMLERVEVLYGPNSTLYGSDALGGVVVFKTKDPKLANGETVNFGVNVMTRYSSANNEGTGHIDFNIGGKKLASLTSVTYSKFDDVRQGSARNPFYNNFGSRDSFVTRVDGQDRTFLNSDPNVQKFSGYSQVDLMEKLLYRQNEHISHTLNLQYSTSSDVPRYDRLTEVRDGKLRYAEWYYGPQERFLAAYNLNVKKLGSFADELQVGVNYQAIAESRHNRNNGSDYLQSRTENLDVIGYNIDFRKLLKKHEFTFGTDGQYNAVASNAIRTDITNNEVGSLDTRYPDGGSNMFYGAVYAQHLYKIIPKKLILNDGIRLNYVSLNARFQDTTFFPFPYQEASQNHTAWSGNLGLLYMPDSKWRFSATGATGFRSPNIDDLAKVFESAGGTFLAVPNPNLKPEYTYNADLGISYTTGDNVFKFETHGFYTWLRNAIVQDTFMLNGQEQIVYQGVPTTVVANQNKAKAYLYGFNAAITAHLNSRVTLYSTINYTYGRYRNPDGTEVPLDHIPPVFGRTSIMYHKKAFRGEFYAMYNGWKHLQDYSPSGEDNLKYATANGMPAWYTLNIRAGYDVNQHLSIQMALENILDQNYRVFASGISAPGRNFVLTVRGHL